MFSFNLSVTFDLVVSPGPALTPNPTIPNFSANFPVLVGCESITQNFQCRARQQGDAVAVYMRK